MPRRTIKVCVRTRPTASFAQDEIAIEPSQSTITINKNGGREEVPVEGVPGDNLNSNYQFRFHHVLHNASQDTVYETLARDVVADAVDGINGTIMSYGQTGSGKTFTMMGDTANYQHRGVAPRSIAHVFQEVNLRVETAFSITCSYMEIYNEKIFDLLTDLASPESRTDFTIAEEKGGRGVFVRGLTEVAVTSEQEALNLMFTGELSRTTAQHKLNRQSNRSHSIFTMYLSQKSRSGVSEKTVVSKLHLVDLAGSERLKKTMDDSSGIPIDDTLKKESMYINQSLTYLEQCVVALARKGGASAHIPYRQTKLTNVLKDSIGGNCNTLMFACIWGEAKHLEETISTLRLASRMMRVQNSASAIEVLDPVKMVKKQERQIKELKQELLMHDALSERTGVMYDPYTPEQQTEMRNKIDEFLKAGADDEDAVLSFESVRYMKELCKQFKHLVRTSNARAGTGGGFRGSTAASGGLGATGADFEGSFDGGGGGGEGQGGYATVGDEEAGHGFGLGMAPDDARPVQTAEGGPRGGGGMPSMRADAKDDAVAYLGAKGGGSPGGMFPSPTREPLGAGFEITDRDASYTMFKRGSGASLNEALLGAKQRLAGIKARARDSTLSCNDAKSEIDLVGEALSDKQRQRQSSELTEQLGEDIVDEEEFALMKQEREAKRRYRDAYETVKRLRAEGEQTQRDVDGAKFKLVSEFEAWHSQAEADAGYDPLRDAQDKLDDQEQFDKLERERVTAAYPEDHDALAFFQAQKTRRANKTQNSVSLRSMHKNKRSVGR